MGLIHVTTTLRASEKARKKYSADFLVDMGGTDNLAPANDLKKAGIKPRGRMAYELADGRTEEFDFRLSGDRVHGRADVGASDLRTR
jgi:hypothetical protein